MESENDCLRGELCCERGFRERVEMVERWNQEGDMQAGNGKPSLETTAGSSISQCLRGKRQAVQELR